MYCIKYLNKLSNYKNDLSPGDVSGISVFSYSVYNNINNYYDYIRIEGIHVVCPISTKFLKHTRVCIV